MTATFKTITVAAGDLVAHAANVRANSPETYAADNIAHLKASISVLGVLQPLLVQKQDGKYGVLAGGRRHAALAALIADKSAKGFTAKTKIECRLVPDGYDGATALSLAENITQAPMSAIDEYEAFARMMEIDGQTPETIAKTFGTTVAGVKGRLRYGMIHADIREAARKKDITLDTMKAFAGHPSQDVQREVFEALSKDGGYMHAYSVRSALDARGVKISDGIGEYVREEYEARGGAIAADLLEEHSVLEDRELVETILHEQLTAAAEQACKTMGFAWADATLSYDYAAMSDYGRVYPGPIEPDETGQKRIDEINAALDQLQRQMEDEDISDDAYSELDERVDELEDEARALQEAYSPEDLARAGVMASWLHGEVKLHVGLVRPEDKQSASQGSAKAEAQESDADEIVYPASLAQDLQTERAMALGAAMALHPEAALDLTLFKLVSDIVMKGMSVTRAIGVTARTEYRSHAKMDEIDSASLEQFAEAHDALDLSWADDARSPADQFAAFRALEAGEKAKLVAFATASTVQSCFARDQRQDSVMHELEIEIMPDIRLHWTPNAALFARFKKAWLLKILGDDLGLKQEAAALASSSKKDIVAFCDKLFAEPFATLTDAQRDAVAAWCPPMMQTAGIISDDMNINDALASEEPTPADAADQLPEAA